MLGPLQHWDSKCYTMTRGPVCLLWDKFECHGTFYNVPYVVHHVQYIILKTSTCWPCHSQRWLVLEIWLLIRKEAVTLYPYLHSLTAIRAGPAFTPVTCSKPDTLFRSFQSIETSREPSSTLCHFEASISLSFPLSGFSDLASFLAFPLLSSNHLPWATWSCKLCH